MTCPACARCASIRCACAHVEPGRPSGISILSTGLRTCHARSASTPRPVSPASRSRGFGWFSRKHGMTIDNLLAVDVITADGRFVRANERENTDLFWALREAAAISVSSRGSNSRLHPLGPGVLSGLVVYP